MKRFIVMLVLLFSTGVLFAQKETKKAKEKTTARQQVQANYTCHMHPDVSSNMPGNCPKCSSKLVVDRRGTKQATTVYTCPMHPDVVSDKAGKCPECGMALTAQKTYTCTMHKDVASDKPGNCPECGMKLVERKPSSEKKPKTKT